jgi:hypothetical protein
LTLIAFGAKDSVVYGGSIDFWRVMFDAIRSYLTADTLAWISKILHIFRIRSYACIALIAYRLAQIVDEGEKGNRNQLEVLFGKGDADDGDGEEQSTDQVGNGDLPAEKNNPDDGKNQLQTSTTGISFNYLFAEWSHRGLAQANGLKTKWYAYDSEHQQETAENVTQSGEEATKY